MTVYIDVVFAVNTIINYIILLVTAKICDIPANRWKIAAGASIGGLYSVAAVLKGYGFWELPVIKLIAGAVMVLISYGQEKRLFKIMVVFFSAAATFAGAILGVSYMSGNGDASWMYRPISTKVLILSFAVSYAVISVIYRRSGRDLTGGGISQIDVEIGSCAASFKALRDTGNSLSEPLSGNRVIVTDIATVRGLFPGEMAKEMTSDMLKKPVQALQQLYFKDKRYKFRLVPYRAVGINGGFLLAVKPDKIYVDKKRRRDILIALSPNKVSSGENYSALIGG